ncbi:MAG: HAD-superfamily hydrolase, subfamily variant 1 [Frankiales bacterium]|nr:HAD-superfamily hydrolase, subfamily variant 1 [Frankiales bacterium]
MTSAPITAITVDLDDTLYPQSSFLEGAWAAVAGAAVVAGVDDDVAEVLRLALLEVSSEDSDRGRIVDRALHRCRLPMTLVPTLVDAFLAHRPQRLELHPGVADALGRLRERFPVAIVTDGDPRTQRAKIAALGVEAMVDTIVVSDELGGRHHRKPSPTPLLAALDRFGVSPEHAVHVGVRPGKDTAAAHAAGMRAIRVRLGEHAGQPDDPQPWLSCADFPAAVAALLAAAPEPDLPVTLTVKYV